MKRREFLKTSAAVAGASAFVAPSFSIGKAGPSANDKINIAMVGNGGIALIRIA
ncbi:MAG: twin-arginine translocation signal domain-containing protein [Phycisphaerae bacterium]|nr:twin-arginine translocation signal domain-containing protein [Phycisphaerae bacterium]